MMTNIRTEIIRSLDGGRLLRFEDPESGLCLEKRLAPEAPVVPQKQRWAAVFERLLIVETGAVAS